MRILSSEKEWEVFQLVLCEKIKKVWVEKWELQQIYDIGANVHKSNLVTLGISGCALLFLIGTKTIIEPRLKKHPILGRIPFPKELITVDGFTKSEQFFHFQIITATVASYYLDLEKKYGVKTIHDIPRGFPEPSLPRVDIWPYIIQDAVSIGKNSKTSWLPNKKPVTAVVAYAVTISMGQIFSKKHKYRLDSNQVPLYQWFDRNSSFFRNWWLSGSLTLDHHFSQHSPLPLRFQEH